MMRTALLLLVAGLGGCRGELPAQCPSGREVVAVTSESATSVRVRFACRLDTASAERAEHYRAADHGVVPPAPLGIAGAEAAEGEVRLTTAPQVGLVTYTLRLAGVRDASGALLDASANFRGGGPARTAPVTFRVDDRYSASLKTVWLLLGVDPLTGAYTSRAQRLELKDPDGDHRFEATLRVAADPVRTVGTKDDALGPQYWGYSARAVDERNRPLSELTLFEVPDEKARVVAVRLSTVPEPPAPEGLVEVTFRVDDRPAGALQKPALRGSFDAQGTFDPTFPSVVELADKDGDGIWEGKARVRIAPDRRLGGPSEQSKPYSVYLVEGATPWQSRSADFAAPDEKPVTAAILVGSPDKVPVRFGVDVSASWLDETGSAKGVYPGEAVFLTGEFGQAEDAFGQNATDAFAGGENVVLQMVERKDRPGVWERTLFLPKNRPYGWKAVRCPKDKGCGQLNKLVTSTGRAFPTVMKNLITELCDASKKQWTDSNCSDPRLIDPRKLGAVPVKGGTLDYTHATIFAGTGKGQVDQKDPPGTPNAQLMFKQEAPDLVVEVKEQPVVTPIYVVGTWRDVNIPGTPQDILGSGTVIDLSRTDYDAGLIGVAPPSYALPAPTRPSPFVMDGRLEATATLVAGGTGTMPIYLAASGDHLYLATDDAGEGSDNLVLLSGTAPGGAVPAPWGKAGTVAFAGKTLVLADENDSGFAGWFELGNPDRLLATAGGGQDPRFDVGSSAQNGGVVEGTVNLKATFGSAPSVLYLAVGAWASGDGGALYSAAQTPATRDGNGNLEAGEVLKVAWPSLKVVP
ncbi:MAG: hypothetical protein IT371_11650 [Deltaproteobacteria bacterium]|nr:hypothetical protein [Deltaproteobacteria bacterium]